MLRYTGERAQPWCPESAGLMPYHVARYAWALKWCLGKRVVDLGSGSGYGAHMLSWASRCVLGIERDIEAVSWARSHFSVPSKCEFVLADLTEVKLPQADVFVAFEILEHLDEPQALLAKVPASALVLWSVPILDSSRYHRQVYTEEYAAHCFGGDLWYQWRNSTISQQRLGKFATHALGVVHK